MGGYLHHCTTAYTPDPKEALESLQAAQLEKYDLPTLIKTSLAEYQEAFDATPENDEYGLHDYYKEVLEDIKIAASQPLPTDFQGRLDLVRGLCDSGEGVGNILDVRGIASKDNELLAAKPLSPDDLLEKFGSDKLLSADADFHAGKANEWLGRGESICFPLYASAEADEPVEWCFVGVTVD